MLRCFARSCVFGFSRLGCAMSMYWGAFLLLRGFQRCRFGPAAGPFFLLCRSSVLSGVALFRMRCRGAAFSASPGSAAPCFLSMYWGSFLLLRWFQRCRFGSAECTVLCCAGARISVVFGCFACIAEELRFRLLQARLRHVFCLWGSFLLLRGFQRCRSGPAAGPVFCCAGARF